MRIPLTHLQRSKAVLHAAQALFVFIGGCLTLAVLTKDGVDSGQTGYYFALCLLSIPALVYQVMVPMWTRAWRFANVYAYAAIDVTYAMLWFAAFLAVATWDSVGIQQGAQQKKISNPGRTCNTFGFGSESRCFVSKASVGMGVIVFLLFCLTSAISIYSVLKFRRTGIMPNGNSKTHGPAQAFGVEDPTKDAWSTNIDELDPNHASNTFDDRHEAEDPKLAYGQPTEEDEEGLLHHDHQTNSVGTHDTATQDGLRHPGRPWSLASEVSGLTIVPPPYYEGSAPSALSPSGYAHSPGGRVSFPEGNYGQL